jgi:hypothetical protein
MNTTTAGPDSTGLTTLAKWGIAISIGALLVPLLGLVAFVIGVVLLIRSEIGPGLGIMALGSLCATLGIVLALTVAFA